VQKADRHISQRPAGQLSVQLFNCGARRMFVVGEDVVVADTDSGADHEDLTTLRDLFTDSLPRAAQPSWVVSERHHRGLHVLPTGRDLTQRGDLEIAEDGHCDRPGDRGGGQHQQVRDQFCSSLQHGALLDPETVLFVDYDHTQIGETDLVGQQRMGAHHDASSPIGDLCLRFPLLGGSQRAGE